MMHSKDWKDEYIASMRRLMVATLGDEPYRWSEDEGLWERSFYADREKYPDVALDVDQVSIMICDVLGWYDKHEAMEKEEDPYYDKYYDGYEDSTPEYEYYGPHSKPWYYYSFSDYQRCVDKGLIINPITRQEFENLVRKLDDLPDDEQLTEDDLDRYCRRK